MMPGDNNIRAIQLSFSERNKCAARVSLEVKSFLWASTRSALTNSLTPLISSMKAVLSSTSFNLLPAVASCRATIDMFGCLLITSNTASIATCRASKSSFLIYSAMLSRHSAALSYSLTVLCSTASPILLTSFLYTALNSNSLASRFILIIPVSWCHTKSADVSRSSTSMSIFSQTSFSMVSLSMSSSVYPLVPPSSMEIMSLPTFLATLSRSEYSITAHVRSVNSLSLGSFAAVIPSRIIMGTGFIICPSTMV